MEVVQEKLTVPGERTALAELRNFVRELCIQNEVHPNTARRVVLAVDEATSNVIEHGAIPADSRIEVRLEIGDGIIVAQIEDWGTHFDPTTKKSDLPQGSSGRKRGFGIYLIRLITDYLKYQRTAEGSNLLTFKIEVQ